MTHFMTKQTKFMFLKGETITFLLCLGLEQTNFWKKYGKQY